MKQKTDWEIYLLMKKYNGENLLSSTELLNIFGYSKKTNIRTTRAFLFIETIIYIHPSQYWKLKNDFVAVLYEDLPEYAKQHMVESAVFGVRDVKKYFSFIDLDGKDRFLIKEEEIPFWKLAKYGGYIL